MDAAIPSPAGALALLEAWGPVAALRANSLAYPLLEFAHLLGLAATFGSVLVVDLRLLGMMRRLDPRALASAVLPWTIAAFALAAASGSAMFAMRAGEMVDNTAFIAKVALLFAAGTNAALLHARGALDPASAATRLQAGLSIVAWMAVIFCGRWIAYF
jgi:hypothetical protein